MRHVEVGLLAGGRGTRMRRGSRVDFRTTPKIFLRLTVDGRRTSLFRHVLMGIAALAPGAVSVLAGRHPLCGPHYLRAELATLPAADRPRVLWDPADRPAGTARALNRAARRSRYPTLIAVPADTFFPFPALPSALAAHEASGLPATWVVTGNPGVGAQNAGRLLVRDGRLVHSGEGTASRPPTARAGTTAATSTGVLIFETGFYRRAFRATAAHLPAGAPIDIYRDVMSLLLRHGRPVGAVDIGAPAPDLGTPERFTQYERRGRACPT